MLPMLLASATPAINCKNNTIDEVARSVLSSLVNEEYSCIEKIIINKDLKFPNGELDPAVSESLNFRATGNKSYLDIAKNGVFISYSMGNGYVTIFFIEKKSYKLFHANENNFKEKFFMKKYFACNVENVNGKWNLTEDFCFTEGD